VPEASTLLLFTASALALVAVPGPNLIYIVTRSLDQGSRAGIASALGVETGTIVHVTAAAVGLSAALASSAAAFSIVKYAGVAYLLYLAARALTTRERPRAAAEPAAVPAARVYVDGLLVQLLNPKVALFFLALLPQFVDPRTGAAWTQILLLGAILAAIGLTVDMVYAIAAGRGSARLRSRSGFGRSRRYVTGGVYAALAVIALVGGRRQGS